jgi:RNA polymerase sigma factor (sigma-70 family)
MSSRKPARFDPHPAEVDEHSVITSLYERYAGHIAAYALRRTTRADAADVVADTFLVVWRRHREVPHEPDTLPWLYGVARRVLANQRRSGERRGKLHERLQSQFVEYDDDARHIEDTERFRRVATALSKLSDDDAELLRLTTWEALSATEIALTLQLDPSAVRQRLHRARQRLRRQLAADGSDGAPFAPSTEPRRASRPAMHHRVVAKDSHRPAEDRS